MYCVNSLIAFYLSCTLASFADDLMGLSIWHREQCIALTIADSTFHGVMFLCFLSLALKDRSSWQKCSRHRARWLQYFSLRCCQIANKGVILSRKLDVFNRARSFLPKGFLRIIWGAGLPNFRTHSFISRILSLSSVRLCGQRRRWWEKHGSSFFVVEIFIGLMMHSITCRGKCPPQYHTTMKIWLLPASTQYMYVLKSHILLANRIHQEGPKEIGTKALWSLWRLLWRARCQG